MSSNERGDGQPDGAGDFQMRRRCKDCDSAVGYITPTGAQDVVRCICGKWQYNAPRTETGRRIRTVSALHDGVTATQRARILVRANTRCEICGRDAATGELHVAHFLSVSDGLAQGLTEQELNSDENLAAFCSGCNLGMGKETVPVRLMVTILMARLRRSLP